MKIARFFAYIFAGIGVFLLVGSMAFFLMNRNGPVRILELPQEAVSCSDQFAQALNAGDLTGAVQYVYGQPDWGAEGTPSTAESGAVWNAFLEELSFEFTGKCYVLDNGLARDASITTLDVASVTQKLPERTQSLVNQRIAAAENLTEIYDEANNFRQELVEEILQEALQQALSQDAQRVTREVTVKLVQQDGRWWVVPDQALLQALSGGA